MNENLKKIVFTSSNVINGKPITIIYHDLDGDWQFFTEGDDFITEEDAKIATLEEILQTDISLKEMIITLPKGFKAYRRIKGDSWNIELNK